MFKILTETRKNKIIIKQIKNKFQLIIDRGGLYDSSRTIELSKRQLKKIIIEINNLI